MYVHWWASLSVLTIYVCPIIIFGISSFNLWNKVEYQAMSIAVTLQRETPSIRNPAVNHAKNEVICW